MVITVELNFNIIYIVSMNTNVIKPPLFCVSFSCESLTLQITI